MVANQPQWPREWLMTDERIGDRLWQAINALPTGAGIVFRHYATPTDERGRLARRVADLCRERDLILGIAGDVALAMRLGARLVHKPDGLSAIPWSLPIHNAEEGETARKAGAALVFVGSVYPSRSHPDAQALGEGHAARLAARSGCPAIALGGMDAKRFAALDAAFPGCFHGYAGIDCWLS